jgi:glycosyltransferase involved in cell wall biosynthesis
MMHKLPKISIITPSFNQGQFIEATILSVLNQRYPNIEYIIIDGASTDHSVEVIKQYAHRLKYWISEPDYGQAHAINKGLDVATGELFAYLNADDLLEPNAVQHIVDAYLMQPNYAMYYGMCTNIDEKGNQISQALGGKISYFSMLTKKMLPFIHQPSCFFQRKFLTRKPIFNIELQYGMDYDLILWIMKKHRVMFLEKSISKFRYHSSSKTVSQTLRMYKEKMLIQRRHAPWLMPLWAYRWLKYHQSTKH